MSNGYHTVDIESATKVSTTKIHPGSSKKLSGKEKNVAFKRHSNISIYESLINGKHTWLSDPNGDKK